MAKAELLPSWLRGRAGSYGWLSGRAAVSYLTGVWERRGKMQPHKKRRQHCWASPTCAVIWQTQHGPAASTNLCPFVLDVVPLSDITNSARKILQPKLKIDAQKLLPRPQNGMTSNFLFHVALAGSFPGHGARNWSLGNLWVGKQQCLAWQSTEGKLPVECNKEDTGMWSYNWVS